MSKLDVRTTSGEVFTEKEHKALAELIHKRFGRDDKSFCAAWRRLLENNAPNSVILRLLAK